ncbi:hypothetical protein, partial [Catenibacterium mitsuokai]|uniref:hypothetical protein n=1 Tax=Catenibacterium mitsuokai TaxID=100886 RepID=UPI0022E15A3E
ERLNATLTRLKWNLTFHFRSKTWKYGQYGTKIIKGLDLREKDEKILIISEEDFMRCIGG